MKKYLLLILGALTISFIFSYLLYTGKLGGDKSDIAANVLIVSDNKTKNNTGLLIGNTNNQNILSGTTSNISKYETTNTGMIKNNISSGSSVIVSESGVISDLQIGINNDSQTGDISGEENSKLITKQYSRDIDNYLDYLGDNLYSTVTDIYTGLFNYKEPIIGLSGKGIDFAFTLYYNTSSNYDGLIGYDWDYSYNIFIYKTLSDKELGLNLGTDFSTILYKQSNNHYISDDKNIDLLIKENESLLRINNSDEDYIFTKSSNGSTGSILSRISRIEDGNGNTINFDYNTYGQLIKIKDTLGKKIDFTYYDNSRLQTVEDYMGNKVEFIYYDKTNIEDGLEYDLKTLNISKDGKLYRTINYTYYTYGNLRHALKTVDDSYANYELENKYNENRRITYYKTTKGIRYIDYKEDSNTKKIISTTVTDREGNKAIYTFDDSQNIVKKEEFLGGKSIITRYSYNKDSLIILETFPMGNGYKYYYDSQKKLIKMEFFKNVLNNIEPLIFTYNYKNNDSVISSIGYGSGKTVTLDDYTGNRVHYFESIRESQNSYNINGVNDDGEIIFVSKGLDIYQTEYGTGGKITGYKLVDNDNLTNIYLSIGAKDLVTYGLYTNALGGVYAIKQTTNGNGQTSKVLFSTDKENTYLYNGLNLLSEKDSSSSTGIINKEFYSYNDNGNLIRKENNGGLVDKFDYDLYGRLIKITDRYGNYVIYNYEGFELIGFKVYDYENNLINLGIDSQSLTN